MSDAGIGSNSDENDTLETAETTPQTNIIKWPSPKLEQLALSQPIHTPMGTIIARGWPLSALDQFAMENRDIFSRVDIVGGDLIVTEFASPSMLHQLAASFFQRAATDYDNSRLHGAQKVRGGTGRTVRSGSSRIATDFCIRNSNRREVDNSNIVGEIVYSTDMAGAVGRATLALTEFPAISLFIVVYVMYPWPTSPAGAYIIDSNQMLILLYPRPPPGGAVTPSRAVVFGDVPFSNMNMEFICSTARVHLPTSPEQADNPVWAGFGIGNLTPPCDADHRELPVYNLRIPGAVVLGKDAGVAVEDAFYDLVLPLFQLKTLIKIGVTDMEQQRQLEADSKAKW